MCEISRQKSVFYFFIEIFFRMCQTTSRRRTGRRRPRTRIYWANQTRRERIRDWLTGNGITILVQEEDETSNSEREQPILDLSPPPASSSLQVYLYNTILLHISRYPLLSMVVIKFYCCNRIIFSRRRRTPAIYRPWRRIPCPPPPPSPPSTSTSTLSSRINTKWRHMKFRCAQVADVSMRKFPNFKKQFRYFKSN